MARKKKPVDDIGKMNQRRKDLQASIHEAYYPVPDYEKIEKLSNEMAAIDEQLYDMEVEKRKK